MKITELIGPSDLCEISKKHYNAYANPHGGQRTSTHRMVLFYAVECALKASLRRRHPKASGNRHIENLLFKKHDIKGLMKELAMPGWKNTKSPIMVIQGTSYSLNDAHLCWRYGLTIDSNSERQITEWLETVYRFLKKGGHI